MNSLFIPEDKAGTIISQQIAQIPHLQTVRERRKAIGDALRFLQLTKLIKFDNTQKDYVLAVSYGCDVSGIRGIVVTFFSTTVATAKEHP